MKVQSDWVELCLGSEGDEMLLEYAIDTFPYKEAFEHLPGYQGNDRAFLTELIDSGLLRIGFYYEDMQEDLTIFYFLQIYDDTYIVLGFDAEVRVEISTEGAGVFQLDEEQFMSLCQIQPS